MATVETGATLRIRTESGSARYVTQLLGIEADNAIEIGDVRRSVSPQPATHAVWMLDSPIDERPLDVHLAALCERVAPVAELLDQLVVEGYRMDWFCFVSSQSQGSVQLDHRLMRTLARFPVDLTLDLYGGDNEDDDLDDARDPGADGPFG
jgi:hypothetical protein